MFEIKEAVRKGTPALIGLWGPSFSGKTRSALELAQGLVAGTGQKIGVIDTENNRATHHTNVVKFDHIDMQPPFTPDRFCEALKAFEKAGGYGCVIVDSSSHAWEGQGGVIDMAESGKTQGGYALTGLKKWQAPKMAYKRMVNAMLRAPFHIIFCLRAKDAIKQEGTGKTAEIKQMGLEPIMGKGFIYEMTVSILLGIDHKPVFADDTNAAYHSNPVIPSVKAPEELYQHIKRGEYLSPALGKAIAAWTNGGEAIDHQAEEVKRVARDIATLGTVKLDIHCKSQNDKDKATLRSIWSELKHLADEADREALQDEDFPGDTPLNGGGKGQTEERDTIQ